MIRRLESAAQQFRLRAAEALKGTRIGQASERITHRAEKPATLAILCGINTNAGAITQFVRFVGEVHHIEPQLQVMTGTEFEALFGADVEGCLLYTSPTGGR